MNDEIADGKLLRFTNEGLVIHLGRYLNRVKQQCNMGQNGVWWGKTKLAAEISDNERAIG